MIYELPNLHYPADALEPFIDEETMKIHHGKHHAAYVDKLNLALENYDELQQKALEELLNDLDSLPQEIRASVQNNGGGHLNHSLFWKIMGPNTVDQPEGELLEEIKKTFESYEAFIDLFTTTALTRFGSGWAWLVITDKGGLKVYSTPNQDNPIMNGDTAILGLDVWEHAYYLKYQNRRAEYIENWFKVLNWQQVSENYNLLTND